MKINLKTLKGQNFVLEVQPEMTVAALKAMISDAHGHPIETQKLIASGKIMDDNQKAVRDFKVVEKSTIVLMTVKAKPVKSAAPEENKQQEQSKPASTAANSMNQAALAQTTETVSA